MIRNRQKGFALFLFAFALLILNACSSDPLLKDLSSIEVDIQIERFDKDMFEFDSTHAIESIQKLNVKYPFYFPAFMHNVIGVEGTTDTAMAEALTEFISHKDMREVYDTCKLNFADLSEIHEGLEEAFKYHTYYFPHIEPPKVLFTMSAFNYQINPVEEHGLLAVGEEMYLGPGSQFYEMLQWPNYRRAYAKPELIVTDCMRGLAQRRYGFQPAWNRFVDHLIYNGKILYFSKAMTPELPDSSIMGYSQKEISWCREYEESLWAYIIDQNVIYSTEYSSYIKYFKDAPFTTNVSPDSPPRLGSWIGWQIIKSYMERNPELELEELMSDIDHQKIFTSSSYRP